MKIRLIGHLGEAVMPVGKSGPWLDFKDVLVSYSNEIVMSDFGQKIDALIANTHSTEAIKECNLNKLPLERRVLVMWEPKSVKPKSYSTRALANYGKIFAPSIQWTQKLSSELFRWPQIDLQNCNPDFANWQTRENKANFVLANKFSACKGELYSLRREVAFKAQGQNMLDIYGEKWNMGRFYDLSHYLRNLIRTPIMDFSLTSAKFLMKRYENYKGSTLNKLETNSRYKINLVIENSADYVSEKLFDSVSSGAITIYVGPNVEEYGLSKNSVIQCDYNSNEILKTIKNIQNIPEDEQIEIAKFQFESLKAESKNWECHLVLKDLAKKINDYLISVEF
jgi:hypothetical protein